MANGESFRLKPEATSNRGEPFFRLEPEATAEFTIRNSPFTIEALPDVNVASAFRRKNCGRSARRLPHNVLAAGGSNRRRSRACGGVRLDAVVDVVGSDAIAV